MLQAMEQFHCQMEQALGRPRAAVWQFFCRKTISVRQTMHRTGKFALSRASPSVSSDKDSPGNRQRRGKQQGCGEIEVKSPFCVHGIPRKGSTIRRTAITRPGIWDGWTATVMYIWQGRKHDLIISGGEKRCILKKWKTVLPG